jgi:hypothetical protein
VPSHGTNRGSNPLRDATLCPISPRLESYLRNANRAAAKAPQTTWPNHDSAFLLPIINVTTSTRRGFLSSWIARPPSTLDQTGRPATYCRLSSCFAWTKRLASQDRISDLLLAPDASARWEFPDVPRSLPKSEHRSGNPRLLHRPIRVRIPRSHRLAAPPDTGRGAPGSSGSACV